jgi:hypothetical protein
MKPLEGSVRYVARVVGVVVGLVGTAEAHPGHGVGGGTDTFHHYFSEPLHAVALMGLLVFAAGVLAWRHRAGLQVRVAPAHRQPPL